MARLLEDTFSLPNDAMIPTSLLQFIDINTAAKDIQSWQLPWGQGAIYPLEMAVFLASCKALGIEQVVESGRGTAEYSTRVLDKSYGSAFTSIDFAPPKNQYTGTMLTGDTYDLLPLALRGKRNVALLIDGPKKPFSHWVALAACLRYDIRLIAMHNYWLGSTWGKAFQRRFPSAFHYESGNGWQQWKEWERSITGNHLVQSVSEPTMAFRSLDQSSLVLARVPSRFWLLIFLLFPRGILTYAHPLKLLWRWTRS